MPLPLILPVDEILVATKAYAWLVPIIIRGKKPNNDNPTTIFIKRPFWNNFLFNSGLLKGPIMVIKI
jgi:hypothetical protein